MADLFVTVTTSGPSLCATPRSISYHDLAYVAPGRWERSSGGQLVAQATRDCGVNGWGYYYRLSNRGPGQVEYSCDMVPDWETAVTSQTDCNRYQVAFTSSYPDGSMVIHTIQIVIRNNTACGGNA